MHYSNEHDDVSLVKQINPDKTLLEELKKGNKGIEFSIESPMNNNLGMKMEDLRVDTAFEYEEYANYLNLDCLNIEDEDDSTTSPFDVIAKKMVNVLPDGGVKKLVKKRGAGGVVAARSLLFIHYNMYLELEEVPFDSSYLRSSERCFKLRLGEGTVFPGFEIAVSSMVVGEKSHFLIHSDYAFRDMGAPPRIPPKATILLEVDLLKAFVGDLMPSGSELGDCDDLKKFKAAHKKALTLHLQGNNFFSSSKYSAAIDSYRKAEDLLTSCSLMNDEEENSQKKLLLKIYRNLCVCYNKTNNPQRVCIAAKNAMSLDYIAANHDAKLHFNWGKALATLTDFSKAADHLRKARSLEPNCKAITDELVNLEERRKQQLKHDKITYRRALGLTDSPPDPQDNQQDPSNVAKENQVLVAELKEFARSNRSRFELPSSLTKEEKEIAQKTCHQLGINFQELKRTSGEIIIAVTK